MKKVQPPAALNPLEFLDAVGREQADATAKKAGLSPAYFNQICYGHRRASVEAAERLVKASAARMGFEEILRHKVKRTRAGAIAA